MYVGLDGLVEIAQRNGLKGIRIDYAENAVTITLYTMFGDFTDGWTLRQAIEDGAGKGYVWREFPNEMLRRYGIRKSLVKHFTGRLEEIEEGK